MPVYSLWLFFVVVCKSCISRAIRCADFGAIVMYLGCQARPVVVETSKHP